MGSEASWVESLRDVASLARAVRVTEEVVRVVVADGLVEVFAILRRS